MERREHDIFLDMASNPGATFDNLVVAGLTASNTALLSKEAYKNDRWVQENELFKNQFGEFDEAKFNVFYDNAKTAYNLLATADYNKSMERQAVYHRNNMFAPPNLKAYGPQFVEYKAPNPYLITQSAYTLGLGGDRTKSVDEIAQGYRVLLNPTQAGDDLSNAEWGAAPEDSFMGSKYWMDTLVLAQYDTDGEYTNLFTGEKEFHKKGELKTDENGNFYYEKLDGRNVYGRRVLNKMNVLTPEGSWINQYDFFDSDDLQQKSIAGSLMKNLALVGTMFLPVVGPWVAGLSVATLLMGVFGTFGKMLTGSDNAFLSELEGWSKSVNRQTAKTEYAQENTWCWENFIDLVGDVMGQLKEQRFVFEKVPTIFKGNTMINSANEKARFAKLLEQEQKSLDIKIAELSKDSKRIGEALKASTQSSEIAALTASAKMRLFNKSFQDLGHILGRGYMTAITVGDTYGEAINNGATDIEATLLTLGYAAGEYAILSTGIGEWFFPEVRNSGLRNQYIAKALAEYKLTPEAKTLIGNFGKAATKEAKKEGVRKLFNTGKNIAKSVYVDGSRGWKASMAAAIGESAEEVSEELLADFSKGAYNTVQWLRGIDTRLDSFGFSWDEGVRSWNSKDLVDRYGMSAVGGFIGGGLTNAGTNYKLINEYKKMDSEKARQELVYMARNGELPEFVKSLKKMLIGNTAIDPLNFEIKPDGTKVFMPGTKDFNEDIYLKKIIEDECRTIDAFLKANGGVPDNVFLNKMVLDELRFNALLNTSTAGMYLQEYNSLLSKLVQKLNDIELKINSAKDANNNGKVEDKEERKHKSRDELINSLSNEDLKWIKDTEKEIKDIKTLISDLLEGKKSYEFIRDAMFEMTENLSGRFNTLSNFGLYVQSKYGRDIEQLTEEEKEKAYKEFVTLKNTEGRELIRATSQQFNYILAQANNVIKTSTDDYLNMSKQMRGFDVMIANMYRDLLRNLENIDTELEAAQDLTNQSSGHTLLYLLNQFASQDDKDRLNAIAKLRDNITVDPALSPEDQAIARKAEEDRINQELDNAAQEVFEKNVNELIKPFIDLGFIAFESKLQLLNLLNAIFEPIKKKYNLRNDEIDLDQVLSLDPLANNQFAPAFNTLKNAIKAIEDLTYTPLLDNLTKFQVAAGVSNPINVLDLIKRVNTVFNETSSNIAQYDIGKNLSEDLDEALRILNMYEAAITASRVDNVDTNNIFGYSITLNEISKQLGLNQPELAEIDYNTANLFIQDIRNTRTKLEFLQRLYKANLGLKLSRNDRVGINKDLLLYNRFKYIVDVPDDDDLKTWNGFDLFLNAIQSLTIHNDMISNKTLEIPTDLKDAYWEEDVKFKLAIYDFIQANRLDIITNPNKLKQLINPTKLLLYTRADGLLSEDTKDLDDNAMIWQLATMGAVNAKDFYGQFAQIIQTELVGNEKVMAPISTHEMAVYTNYALAVDPDLFKVFYNTYRESVKEHWKSLNLAERERIFRDVLKRDNADMFLVSDDFADYCLNFLPVPRYKNISLTEGIPGSGKTASVLTFTKQLLETFHPDLLEDAIVASGIDEDGAKNLLKGLKIDPNKSKVFDREGLMKFINSNWVEYEKNADGSYKIDESEYVLDADNQMRHKADNITTLTANIPRVIFIDEISKFSSYDLDLIEKFADKHGIVVIAAGDFDLMGITGHHPITNNIPALAGRNNTINLSRTDFIRTLKLGVSMRTSNSLKSTNISKMLLYMLNPTNLPLEFRYFEDNDGLHGDKVFRYAQSDIAAIIPELKQNIVKLIGTLNPGEKIGYIYNDENSPIYLALMSAPTNPGEPNISDFLEPKKGGTAQGQEARYYITEANSNLNKEDYLRQVYTGMSRAELGSIIIAPIDHKGISFDSKENTENVNEPISGVIPYAKRRKELLTNLSKGFTPVLLVPRLLSLNLPNNQPPGNNPPPQGPPSPPSGPNTPPGGNPPSGPTGLTPIDLSSYPFNIGDEIEMIFSNGSTSKFTIKNAYTDSVGNKLIVEHLGSELVLSFDEVVNEWGTTYKLAPTPDPNAHLVELATPLISNILDIFDSFALYKDLSDKVNESINELNTNDSLTIDDINNIVLEYEVLKLLTTIDVLTDFPELRNAIDRRRKIILDKLNKEERHNRYIDLINNTNNLSDLRILHNTLALDGTIDEFNDLLLLIANKGVLLEAERKSKVLNEISTANTIELLEQILQDNEVDTDTETEIVEAYKLKVLDLQQIELLKRYDNLLIDLGSSTISLEDYEKMMDELNETKTLPLSTVKAVGKQIKISMLLHSLNTFELGVEVGPDGMPRPFGGRTDFAEKRIDSVNGLMKIDSLLGKPIRTVSQYIELLGDLRKIIYNTPEKVKLIQKLENKLGLLNIYCKFALKSSKSTENINNGLIYPSSEPNPLDKSSDEKSLYNQSGDTRSLNIHHKSIVLVIGTDATGNILELPLLALSNPFTLLSVLTADFTEPLSPVRTRYEALKNNSDYWLKDSNGNVVYNRKRLPVPDLYKIADTLYNEFKNLEEFKEITDLLKLFTINDNAIFFINDDNWTIAKNLDNEGAVVTTHKGYYQIVDGLDFNDDTNPEDTWMALDSFARGEFKEHLETIGVYKHLAGRSYRNPVCVVTERIMVSKTGNVEYNGVEVKVCKPSHPFVLVSYADNLTTDSEIYDYFIKQETGHVKAKKVKLMHVLPPHATVKEYLQNIHDIIQNPGNSPVPIGTITTSYTLLLVLMKNDEFKRRLEKKKSGLVARVEEAFRLLEGLEGMDLANALRNPTKWPEIPGKENFLAGLFDGVLYNVAYSINDATPSGRREITFDENDANMIERILKAEGINKVYYHAVLSKDMPKSGLQFEYPIQEDGYRLGGKQFMIHGKIDLPTFKGELGNIIADHVLSKLIQNGVDSLGRPIYGSSETTTHYYDFRNKRILNANKPRKRRNQPPTNTKAKLQQQDLINTINTVARKLVTAFTGRIPHPNLLNPGKYFENKSYLEGLKDLINDINNYSNAFAFSIGDLLFIDTSNDLFTNNLRILDNNNNLITDIKPLFNNNGECSFKVQYNGNQEATVKFSNNKLEFTLPSSDVQISPFSNVTPENFTGYVTIGKTFLGNTLNMDRYLGNIFNALTIEEFRELISKVLYLENNGQSLREKLLSRLNAQSAEELQLVQDILALDEYAKLKKDGNCTISSFTISL